MNGFEVNLSGETVWTAVNEPNCNERDNSKETRKVKTESKWK